MVSRLKRKDDRAYACFFTCGTAIVVVSLLSLLPTNDGTAAGLGFFVAVPLGIVALSGLLAGLGYTIAAWPQAPLIVLAVCSLLFIVEFFFEIGPGKFYNGVTFAYGMVAMAVPGWWFLSGRRGR